MLTAMEFFNYSLFIQIQNVDIFKYLFTYF